MEGNERMKWLKATIKSMSSKDKRPKHVIKEMHRRYGKKRTAKGAVHMTTGHYHYGKQKGWA